MSKDDEKGVPQDAKDWVAPISTGGEAQEFSIEATNQLLKQAATAREERAKSDVVTIEQLIAREQQLEAILKQGEEQVAYFTTLFELNPPDPKKDQKEIDLLNQLRESVSQTQQAILENVQKINKLSSQPEVMGRIKDEAEAVQRSKEKYKEIEASIDEIKRLWDSLESLLKQSHTADAEASQKNTELWQIPRQSERQTDNPNLRAVFRDLSTNNWPESMRKLQGTREQLGWFKGKDKALIDNCLKRFPVVLAEYKQLEQRRIEIDDQIKGVKKQAELLRKNLTEFMFGTGQDGRLSSDHTQRDHLMDKYKTVIGKSWNDRLSYGYDD